MASWYLVPCLVSLRAEFDALAPRRGRASDGAVGDPKHSRSPSDHNPDETGKTPYDDADSTNEVHAIDVDKDGVNMERCVQTIVLRHRKGLDNRLQNVIYNRRIWSRTWGWTARAYTGANKHTQHAHFSARYTPAAEADARPWGLLNLAGGDAVNWTDDVITNPSWRSDAKTNPTVQVKFAIADTWNQAHDAAVATAAAKLAATVGAASAAAADEKAGRILVLLTALAAKDFTDEAAIVKGVLADLDAKTIAAAIPSAMAKGVVDDLVARLRS